MHIPANELPPGIFVVLMNWGWEWYSSSKHISRIANPPTSSFCHANDVQFTYANLLPYLNSGFLR
jgi:hypothetical protein